MAKKVVFLGTGGTIAGRSADRSDNVGYQAAQVGVAQLLEGLPALAAALQGITPESEQVAQVDSKDMDWPQWQALHTRALHHLQRDDVGALVITHGTDTLEETAFFLSQALPSDLLASKPVVLTCAMRPSTADFPDGPQNLCDAAVVANSPGAEGVLVVCAAAVHTARDMQKVHPYRLDAFSSGEAGPTGWVEEGQVRWARPLPQDGGGAMPGLQLPTGAWPRVEIVLNAVGVGVGGAVVRALCATPAEPDARVGGIVVAGTGNGTINHDMAAALASARAQGVRVVVTTRCASGQLVGARGLPVVDAEYLGLSVVKARIALVLELLGER
ncbi:MAG: L-asparaginase [Burkholderiales bacterium PBB3]|nr:MAG: L-asparaginase [Burkholderiales bacterium PBB3]